MLLLKLKKSTKTPFNGLRSVPSESVAPLSSLSRKVLITVEVALLRRITTLLLRPVHRHPSLQVSEFLPLLKLSFFRPLFLDLIQFITVIHQYRQHQDQRHQQRQQVVVV